MSEFLYLSHWAKPMSRKMRTASGTLNHVGPVQVGAWGQVVLGQIAQERQSGRTFRPRQQQGERFQEQIEDRDAGLPSDVHGPKDQQQGADEHPKFRDHSASSSWSTLNSFRKARTAAAAITPKKGQNPKAGCPAATSPSVASANPP